MIWSLNCKEGLFIAELEYSPFPSDFFNGEKVDLCWVEFEQLLNHLRNKTPLTGYFDPNDFFVETKNGKIFENMKIFFVSRANLLSKKKKKKLFFTLFIFLKFHFFFLKQLKEQ